MAIAHEQKWVSSNAGTITGNVADKPSSDHQWYQEGLSGKRIMPGIPEYMGMLSLETFLHMMPPAQLALMLELTNARLATKEKWEMTRQELLRWIGVCMLIASINFHGGHRKLWQGAGATSKYLPSNDLCATGMLCNRFNDRWYAIRWYCQPPQQQDGILSEQYRWMLVNDFVANIDEYRLRLFYPGNHLEANDTIIEWYGIGGAFFDAGLPMYLALEHKPNNGGKIQNLANVALGIMLHFKVVKSATKEKATTTATATGADKSDDTANEGGKGIQVLFGVDGAVASLLQLPTTRPISTCVLIGHVVGNCSKSNFF
jgi:hypothetical protein